MNLEKITRRTALAVIPVVAAATALPALAGATDPHIEWERELHALQARARELWAAVPNDPALASSDIRVRKEVIERLGIYAAEERARQVDIESLEVEKKICLTRAETIAGLLVQARLLAKRLEDFGDDNDAALASHMLTTMERMAEGGAS